MMSALHEGYRRTLRMRTAEGDAVTLERGHRHGRVWLSLGGTTQTTVTLSGAQVGELTGALRTAAGNSGGATPSEAAVGAATTALTAADVIQRVLQAAYEVDSVFTRRQSAG